MCKNVKIQIKKFSKSFKNISKSKKRKEQKPQKLRNLKNNNSVYMLENEWGEEYALLIHPPLHDLINYILV